MIKPFPVYIGVVLLVGLSGVISSGTAAIHEAGVAVQSTATPDLNGLYQMVPTPDRLARPVLPDHPTQADFGAQVYYMVCMACHGDQGQGLSPEWIEAWELGEESCWQSKCHASNHPPEGFELPKYIPAVVSPGMVNRFTNARELHDYLQTKMPWQAPASLTSEEYWQLTAFLLRANGIDPGFTPLDEQSSQKILMRPVSAESLAAEDEPAVTHWFWITAGVILSLVGTVLLVKYIQRLINPLQSKD